jgi:tetratricopeptide (TPR) repeat protein
VRPLRALALAFAAAVLLGSCASSQSATVSREWYDIGNAWFDKGDWKRAGQAYSRAIALDPSFAGASYNLARALVEAADYDGAIKVLDALLKRDPKNLRALSTKAYAYYKKGADSEALEAYKAVLALDPYAPDAVFNAALLESRTGDYAAAVAQLGTLTEAKPEDGQAFLLLGRALDMLASAAAGSNDLSDAAPAAAPTAPAATADQSAILNAYEKARVLGKADAPALQRIGQIYESGRRYADAMDAYDAAVKADAKLAAAWFALARLRLVVAQDEDKGLEALKAALDSGFADKDAVQALLDEPDLPAREKVYDALKDKGLAP